MGRWHSFVQLFMARLREFYREPIVLFWVYGFPVLLAVGLGVAFKGREAEPATIDVQQVAEADDRARKLVEALKAEKVRAGQYSAEQCQVRYRTGKTALYVVPTSSGYRYVYDPTREESLTARSQVESVVQRLEAGIQRMQGTSSAGQDRVQNWTAGPKSWQTSDSLTTEPGNRYIDFLLPGLMGMNLMGGGLWGVGFVIVDMRVRKLLKRLLATPMRKDYFLLSILVSRMVFMLPEMLLLLMLGSRGFGMPVHGNWLTLALIIVVGAMAFSGIGLLVACRTSKTEAVSGLMNLVMLPMWVMSGVFFSSKRFPDPMQPFIQALPLTQLNDALREVILENCSLAQVSGRLAILAAYAITTFFIGLRWFRWQ